MKKINHELIFPFAKEELEDAVKLLDEDLKKLGTLGKSTGARIAEGSWVYGDKIHLVNRFKQVNSAITGLPIENQESPHFIKYEVGGKYSPHFDFFKEGTEYYDKCVSRGGQRVFSTILYLNDNFEGGETHFPKLDLTVKPIAGKIFCWRNLNEDGSLNKESLHGGNPVVSGVKYILVIWTRERKFS
jgi:predicted 2-oxoglutarate/Fe(II)-dependent dioxygenase YbiX